MRHQAGYEPDGGRLQGELVAWYNTVRLHMSLNLDVIETPSEAFIRKMPKEGTVSDERSGEIYHASKE